MARYVKSGTVNTVQEINSELEKIATAQEDFLTRDSQSPNEMLSPLDMNSHRITNLPAPVKATDAARLADVTGKYDITVGIDESPVFDNVAEMTSTDLTIGQLVKCKRYYAGGDLVDGLVYEVQASASVGGYVDHQLVNGLFAVLLADGVLNARLAGADPSVDNVSILNSLANYTNGWYVCADDELPISSTVTSSTCKHIDIQGKLIYTGTQDKVALDINGGATSSSDTIRNCFFRTHVESQSQSDWSDPEYIGTRITNVRRSEIIVSSSKLFTRGVVFRGKGHGFVYNEVKLFELSNNKEDVVLSEEEGDSSATGFVNENNFYGGNFLCTAVNTSVSRYGIVIETDDTYQNNNNVFNKPSFEKAGTTVTGGAEAVPVVINSGTRNIIKNARIEGGSSDGVLMRCTGSAQGNIFQIGYINATVGDAGPWQVEGLDNQSTKVNFVYNRSLPEYTTQLSYPNVVNLFSEYDSTDQSVRGGLLLKESGSAIDNYFLNGYTLNDASVSFGSSRAVGLKIQMNGNKEIGVSRSTGASKGRILIQCYDASDTLLDDTSGDLVVNLTNNSLSFIDIYGGGWRYNSDNDADQIFLVDDSVAFIVVLFVGAQELKSFTINIRQNGSSPSIVDVFKGSVYENRLATQIPEAGSFKRGYVLYNDSPSSSGFVGWVATADVVDASLDNTAFKTFGAISS